MSNFVDDLENWMGLLSDSVRNIPIIYLSIPGTHNSLTYGINSKSMLAPDAEDSVKKIDRICPSTVRRWARTQSSEVTQQLMNGIRYFDLRIGSNRLPNVNDKFFIVHGLYSMGVTNPLVQIQEYLMSHPREFVIIDCQHFYDIGSDEHFELQQKFLNIFGAKVFTRNDGTINRCTLNYATNAGKQVLIIYRFNGIMSDSFWPSYIWHTPWPNTTSVRQLKEDLESSLSKRSSAVGYVSQCIITPTTKYIVPRFYLSLRSVANGVNRDLLNWVTSQRPGPFTNGDKPTTNVIIADFIDLRDWEFCKAVIKLNEFLETVSQDIEPILR